MNHAASKLPDGDNDVIAMLRDSAGDFCARALPCGRLRALRGASPAFDREIWRQMADLGWTALFAPTSRDGLDLGAAAAAAVCRKLGGVAAPEPLIESALSATALLCALDGADDLLAAMQRGDVIVTAAMGTSDADAFAAVRADGSSLYGTCRNVPLGGDADGWLIPASEDGVAAWFYVVKNAQGIVIKDLELADGSRDADVSLDGCVGLRLGSGAAAVTALVAARNIAELASSAYLLGLSEALFEMTTSYLCMRRQFGRAIASFQVIQHRLVDLYLALRLTRAVVEESCIAFDTGTPHDVRRAASRARFRAGQTALAVSREAVQLHGAIGTTDECDVGLLLNRALVVVARYGHPNVHVQRLNRLRPHRSAGAEALDGDSAAEPADGDWNALGNNVFRGIVRNWFEQTYPAALRNPRARLRWHECRDWYATLYRRGWAAPAWPREHGGMGLDPEKLLIFIEERERLGVARTPDQGIIMVGPLLMQHGSAEQRDYYLPQALCGEHIWCQGYSEPNAGSDLAALATSALRDGDEFVINGQKIWTTLAQDATHMFCLVRTDASAKPQAGISFVLIDFNSPGITVRPIRNIAGDEEFCEVFFDDVRVPVANLVGELNDGWRIAKALLSFERIFIGSPKQCQHALNRLHELADARGLWDDPVFVDRLSRFEIDVADLETLYKEFADILRRGATLGPDVSLLKIWASETVVSLSEFMLEAAGATGACAGDIDINGRRIDILSHYYNARPTPIYGGSNEIQRNILAKQILLLPSE